MTSSSVVFVHSLFRSGSTYLFNVFRQAEENRYWCYQEPLHEASFLAQTAPDTLLTFDSQTTKALRHPALNKPYFFELYEVKEAWLGLLPREASYEHYFANSAIDSSIPFFQALIKAAKKRPVIQECRTACRIGHLKKTLGGVHLYLWRNPWDQWWSYQINDYFNAANLLIINADQHPPEIVLFRQAIAFRQFKSDDFAKQLQHFQLVLMPSAISYQLFYLLWCMGLREGLKQADHLINIDQLSNHPDYRTALLQKLVALGIPGCDFSDCHIPQMVYAEQDQAFFHAQEATIHQLLKTAGWPETDLSAILTLREIHAPTPPPLLTATEIRLSNEAEKSRTLTRQVNDEVIARLYALKVPPTDTIPQHKTNLFNNHLIELDSLSIQILFSRLRNRLSQLLRKILGKNKCLPKPSRRPDNQFD